MTNPGTDQAPPPGARLERGWLRRLYALIDRRTRLEGGPGIAVTPIAGGGYSLSASDADGGLLRARVTAAPAYAPTDPAACLYAARAFGRDGVTLSGAAPVYGRPTAGGEFMLWPARVGDRCYIVRETLDDGSRADRLWVLTEAIAGRPCG